MVGDGVDFGSIRAGLLEPAGQVAVDGVRQVAVQQADNQSKAFAQQGQDPEDRDHEQAGIAEEVSGCLEHCSHDFLLRPAGEG